MDLTLDCQCSRRITVNIASAGAKIPCECGRQIAVPSLAAFRSMAGLSAIPLNTAQQIEQKVRAGELPGTACCGCGNTDADLISVAAHCEKSYSKHGGTNLAGIAVLNVALNAIFAMLMAPFFILLRRRNDDDPGELVGRDTSVLMPIRLCGACQQKAGFVSINPGIVLAIFIGVVIGCWMFINISDAMLGGLILIGTVVYFIAAESQRQQQRVRLKCWLKTVPEYEQLLKEFPQAEIERC